MRNLRFLILLRTVSLCGVHIAIAGLSTRRVGTRKMGKVKMQRNLQQSKKKRKLQF